MLPSALMGTFPLASGVGNGVVVVVSSGGPPAECVHQLKNSPRTKKRLPPLPWLASNTVGQQLQLHGVGGKTEPTMAGTALVDGLVGVTASTGGCDFSTGFDNGVINLGASVVDVGKSSCVVC